MNTLTLQSAPTEPRSDQPHHAHSKPRMSSAELFRDGSELIIEHRGEEYRLKLTRNQKLILNK